LRLEDKPERTCRRECIWILRFALPQLSGQQPWHLLRGKPPYNVELRIAYRYPPWPPNPGYSPELLCETKRGSMCPHEPKRRRVRMNDTSDRWRDRSGWSISQAEPNLYCPTKSLSTPHDQYDSKYRRRLSHSRHNKHHQIFLLQFLFCQFRQTPRHLVTPCLLSPVRMCAATY